MSIHDWAVFGTGCGMGAAFLLLAQQAHAIIVGVRCKRQFCAFQEQQDRLTRVAEIAGWLADDEYTSRVRPWSDPAVKGFLRGDR